MYTAASVRKNRNPKSNGLVAITDPSRSVKRSWEKDRKEMKKYFVYIIFIIGVILANYTTEWDWEHIKLFISGGLTGIWIMMILAKKHCNK